MCERLFRRETEKFRYKCITEQDKTVTEQLGMCVCVCVFVHVFVCVSLYVCVVCYETITQVLCTWNDTFSSNETTPTSYC